ncbi:(deoxy)nucleoside triphosphate pyrophosphohydrolase [Brachybacterium sp. GCM10030267]|uniref:(deoxy)nucleoside triphosphate pyrophosphohydrolase n=1 Tax=Brachybacterium sp. GCM10030267 TaxID=3273381 RepID=UPI0036202D27
MNSGEQIFAARRNPDRSAGGLWEFPGGKISPGESPTDALRRELHEELAITVSVGELAGRATTQVGHAMIDLACYWASLDGPEPATSTDHDAMGWFAIPDLLGLTWSPADVPVLRVIEERFDRPL